MTREVFRNVQPFPQPSPARNPGGDCFVCATLAIYRALYPEQPPSFEQVIAWWQSKDGHTHNTWGEARQAFYNSYQDGYRPEIMADRVDYFPDPERASMPWFRAFPVQQWHTRLEAWLSAGWLAFAEVLHDGTGIANKEGLFQTPDHFVVLDGVRRAMEPYEYQSDGKTYSATRAEEYVHVVCSARGAFWMRTGDFLRLHGANGWWLLRRSDEEAA